MNEMPLLLFFISLCTAIPTGYYWNKLLQSTQTTLLILIAILTTVIFVSMAVAIVILLLKNSSHTGFIHAASQLTPLPTPRATLMGIQPHAELFFALEGRMNIDEIEKMAYVLDEDIDLSKPGTKSAKIRDVIVHFSNRGEVRRIYQYIWKHRPDIELEP